VERDRNQPQRKAQGKDETRRPPAATAGGRPRGSRFLGDSPTPGYFTITTLCDSAKPGPAMRT
jgi:hypothetical protein